jgi:hypothetical protein
MISASMVQFFSTLPLETEVFTNFLGLLRHTLFEQPVMRAILHQQLAAFQRFFYVNRQFLQVKRLRDVIVGAEFHRVNRHVCVGGCRQHDHGDVRVGGHDPLQQVDPRQAGHHDIAQDEMEGLALEKRQGVIRGFGRLAFIAHVTQLGGEQLSNIGFVIDD